MEIFCCSPANQSQAKIQRAIAAHADQNELEPQFIDESITSGRFVDQNFTTAWYTAVSQQCERVEDST